MGDRRRYVDKANAARKEAYGILSMLPHKHAGLPWNYADRFCRRARVKGEEEEATIESVEAEITAKKKEADALRAELSAES